MATPVILALDIGTSSSRTAIFDARGKRLLDTTAQFDYPLITGADGHAELRPADLERSITRALTTTIQEWRKLKSPAPIIGIGVSCFWHSLLGLDTQGRPITPVYTWADSRCRKEADFLRNKVGEAAMHSATGCMARTSFWPAKLLWLRKTKPGLFRRVSRWVSPAEWIQERFCGQATASLSMASGTGLLNGCTLDWHASLLKRCQLSRDQLNPLSDSPSTLTKAAARRFPELANVPWFPAIGDGAASNLGSGATGPGVAAINVGTSAALRVVVPANASSTSCPTPFGLFSYRVDDQRRLMGGAVSNAGNLRAWAIRELKLPDDPAKIEKLLAARSGPVTDITMLPFWIAERAPTWPEEISSAIVGMTQATTALDILQAFQEATYHRLAQIGEALESTLQKKLIFIVSGGIQRSPSALQRLANVLGRPVHASAEPEASLCGAACFALGKLGFKMPASQLGPKLNPIPAIARCYARARAQQVRLEVLFRDSPTHQARPL